MYPRRNSGSKRSVGRSNSIGSQQPMAGRRNSGFPPSYSNQIPAGRRNSGIGASAAIAASAYNGAGGAGYAPGQAERRHSDTSFTATSSMNSNAFLERLKEICACCVSSNSSCGVGCRHVLRQIALWTNSKYWRVSVLIATVFLFFGPPIQFLACPKSWDLAFSIIFSAVVVILMADLVANCLIDPNYFLWHCPLMCCNTRRRGTSEEDQQFGVEERKRPKCWKMGSFMFWLDLISIISLLPEIQYINPKKFALREQFVDLDPMGYPIRGMDWHVVIFVPVQTVFVVGRSARLARFIRASKVVEISRHTFNVYLIHKWLRRKFCCCFPQPQVKRIPSITPTMAMSSAASHLGESLRSFHSSEGSRSNTPLTKRLFWFLYKNEDDQSVSSDGPAGPRSWRGGHPGGGGSRGEDEASTTPTSRRPSLIGSALRRSASVMMQNSNDNRRRGHAKHKETSQVGTAMRELTGQRVAVGIIVALIVVVIFTYTEPNQTQVMTMISLHSQTEDERFSEMAVNAARSSSVPELYQFTFANETTQSFPLDWVDIEHLRESEKLNITVSMTQGNATSTSGMFVIRATVQGYAAVQLMVDIFILLIWFFGVTSFAGPVMSLVVIPIERMIRLLSMLTKDPLGYQKTPQYRSFTEQEYDTVRTTHWEWDVLQGMETSFLMSTILRIGGLMRVGFGSAGVEIIRNNLQRGTRYGLVLNQRGSTVSCIFLFCDIRQFTDATEALQEEVFVFTNKIASVVHSICNAYGGSANKNVGDAFLLSWRLDDNPVSSFSFNKRATNRGDEYGAGLDLSLSSSYLLTRNDKADKALLSVIQISIALYNDNFFIEDMTPLARDKLLEKTKGRHGPVVQMGFGLHAGRAVQGAIGSQRKIDPAYVAESVERAEMLESSTKQYGLRVLMSDAFHDLLSEKTRRRCRKVDQVILDEEDDEDQDIVDCVEPEDTMELFTFDMDIDALFKGGTSDCREGAEQLFSSRRGSQMFRGAFKGKSRRVSKRPTMVDDSKSASGALSDRDGPQMESAPSTRSLSETGHGHERRNTFSMYDPSLWSSPEMRLIRHRYSDGLFFRTFDSGLQAYMSRDWAHAKQCFTSCLERFDDGPSKYFLKKMEESNGVPPPGFIGYGRV